MTDLKQAIALTSLNAMMQKSYFDICTVDSVGELLGVNPRGCEAYRMLHPLHCVHWQKMPPTVRDAVPAMIEQCLGITPVFQFATVEPGRVIDVTPAKEQPRRGFLRLLGAKS